MSIINSFGEKISPLDGEIEVTDEVIDRLRDHIILRLYESGVTLKHIGMLFRFHESTACRRLQKIQRSLSEPGAGGEDG